MKNLLGTIGAGNKIIIVIIRCLINPYILNLNVKCSSRVLRSVGLVKYSSTAFSIKACTWQLNNNHDVNFLACFLELVVPMLITSLHAHVQIALIADWHSLQHCSQNLFLTLQSTLQNLNDSG